MSDWKLMQYFAYKHLPEHLQHVSKPFGDLAKRLYDGLPHDEELNFCLRKLLEAKDCAVRCQLTAKMSMQQVETMRVSDIGTHRSTQDEATL